MDDRRVKREVTDSPKETSAGLPKPTTPVQVINITDSDSDSDIDISSSSSGSDSDGGAPFKKRKKGVLVPEGFLAPLQLPPPLPATDASPLLLREAPHSPVLSSKPSSKQFWKAGDYEGGDSGNWNVNSGGIDRVRVHPRFLHSNATSHKWALGALAELLDNALDEIYSGATYVNIDMLENKKDGSKMLLIEDDGGGMDPDKMRQCMSLGYSAKSKVANTIGQYGNGFKTSTMRLGADVIVFSRCKGKDGKSPTQSIGLLSYTFLRSTGMEDIIVPMLDYERQIGGWNSMQLSSSISWNINVETITQWSPFSSENDLLRQFSMMGHGTRIIIYNLWEDDRGLLELDFDADDRDIQLGGVNRDEKNIKMATDYPNSRHFLTYRHSLRSYASILYLRVPPGFRIILRGKDVQHHNIVNDMMMSQEVTYRPQPNADGIPKDDMAAVVTIGFVKDAIHHIDVQGFNVYHKNRLIKPFWRLWNPAGSGGRGVIGVLEANFVEPAHDKQGFERTTVLARLEGKLIQIQKKYWKTNCQEIGYVSNKKTPTVEPIKSASKFAGHGSSNARSLHQSSDKYSLRPNRRTSPPSSSRPTSSSAEEDVGEDLQPTHRPKRNLKGKGDKTFTNEKSGNARASSGHTNNDVSQANDRMDEPVPHSYSEPEDSEIMRLNLENKELKERSSRLERTEDVTADGLITELEIERERSRTLERELEEAKQKIEDLTKEQETLIEIFSEERERRQTEEETLRNRLKEASTTIQDLLDKVKIYENMKSLKPS